VDFTIERRGGPHEVRAVADFGRLQRELAGVAARFSLTKREIRGNKVVRVAKEAEELSGGRGGGGGGGGGGVSGGEALMGQVGRMGQWFARLRIGRPEQTVELVSWAWDLHYRH
jgi:hypothetical protein